MSNVIISKRFARSIYILTLKGSFYRVFSKIETSSDLCSDNVHHVTYRLDARKIVVIEGESELFLQ